MKLFSSLLVFVSISFHLLSQDVPVDPLTGRPQISIPLASVTSGTISAGVTLSHSGDAIKVGEGSGSAGMGWSVVAGGSVTREVRSLPDDYVGTGSDLRKGWLEPGIASAVQSFASTSNDDLTVCSDEVTDYTTLNGFLYTKDTEPDIFYINAPGLSASFVFDGTVDGNGAPVVRMLTMQDIKVVTSRVSGAAITKFEVYNNLGVKYTFDIGETATRQSYKRSGVSTVNDRSTYFKLYEQEAKFTSNWYLSKIEAPEGGVLRFTYDETSSAINNRWVSVINQTTNNADTLYQIADKIPTRSLTSITNNVTIDAVTISLVYTDGLISQVVTSAAGSSKRFAFTYRFARNANDNAWEPEMVPFLYELKEENGCLAFPSYEFEYEGVYLDAGNAHKASTMPLPTKSNQEYKQDLWGYYNPSVTSITPTVYYNNSPSDGERYRIFPRTGYTVLSGATRTVNTSTVATGALKKIKFPTGATVSITYEPHDFYDAGAAVTQLGGGVRVKRVRVSDSYHKVVITDYEYKRADGQSSGRWTYPMLFAYAESTTNTHVRTPDNLAPETELLYDRITIKQIGKGKTVYEFTNAAMYPSVFESGWTATKTKVARSSGSSCTTNLVNGYYSYPNGANKNFDFERGLVNRKQVYNEGGDLLVQEDFTYENSIATTYTIKGIRLEKLGLTPTPISFATYSLVGNSTKFMRTQRVTTYDVADLTKKIVQTTGHTYYLNGLVDSVTVKNSNGDYYKTRYRYAYNYSVSNASTATTLAAVQAVEIKRLNDSHRHAMLIEQTKRVKKGGTETVLGGELNFFRNLSKSDGTPRTMLAEKHVFTATSGYTDTGISGSPQVFTWATAYRPVLYNDVFDDSGNLLASHDANKNQASAHYGYDRTLPVLTIQNARHDEVVFSDFESNTGYQFTLPPSAIQVTGWSGLNARALTLNTFLERTGVVKNGSKYRYSFRVTGAANSTVTVKVLNGTTLRSSAVVSYITPGQWKFFDGVIDVSTATSPFTVQILTSAALTFDDVAFYPEIADVVSTTHAPLYGVTSQINGRGEGVYKEYDALGRLSITKDQDKNIIAVEDYHYRNEPWPTVISSFNDNSISGNYDFAAGSTAIFTPHSSCLTGVTYAWKIIWATGSATPTGNPMNYVFTQPGKYVVELTATHPTYGSSTTRSLEYQVGAGPLTVQSKLQQGQSTTINECDASYSRTFMVTNVTGCHDGNFLYKWQYKLNSTGVWVDVFIPGGPGGQGLTHTNTVTFDVNTVSAAQGYMMRCVITSTCNTNNLPPDAATVESSGASPGTVITFQDETTCQ